jgi:signal transduction histidine kinase
MIRVLYVDDEETLLELAKEFLEASHDIVLETATNARAGIQKVLELEIDVVVSDYMMPEMDGLAFLRALREAGNDVPFILFTGKGREEVVIQALNEGADSYLQKGGQPRPQFTELAHRINRAAERRNAVMALRQSEARLKRAEEIAGFGHWELHLDRWTMYSSSGARIIYGTNDELKSYEDVKTIPLPEFRPLLDMALKNLIEKGEIYDIEFKARRPSDGRIVEVHSRAEYDPVHRIVFGVLQDITERKRAQMEISLKNEELEASYAQMSFAEEELMSAQHQLAVAMDLAKLVYWDMDLARGVFIFNDSFYALYSTSAELEGGDIMKIDDYTDRFVHPEDKVRVAKIIEQNMSSPIGTGQTEHRIVRRDGQVRDIVVCIEVERDQTGRPFHVYGANQDITDRKKAEVTLERANRKLNLLNSITRHDINNQISILRGNLELVKIKVTDPEAQSRLDKVDRSSRNILDQIRFTKEYQDMGSTAPQWQNLAMIVRNDPQSREVKDLQISDEAARLSLYADPMLPKVFHNLIENTLRYAGKPSSIRITCGPSVNGMKLVYEDVGPGVPNAEKDRIFDKGFGKGTGLGLFLSREILVITGMTIQETGIEGRGARFEISIPVQMFRC